MTELDEASQDHPVYIHQFGFGPAVTNSEGKRFLEAEGIVVGEDGVIAAGANALAAHALLKGIQTEEDRMRTTREIMTYVNSLGLTTVIDAAGGNRPELGAQQF